MDVLCTMLLWSIRVRSTGNKNIIIDPKHYWREEGIEGGGKRDGERRRGGRKERGKVSMQAL